MKSKGSSSDLSVHSVKAICRVLWAVFQYTLKNIPIKRSTNDLFCTDDDGGGGDDDDDDDDETNSNCISWDGRSILKWN